MTSGRLIPVFSFMQCKAECNKVILVNFYEYMSTVPARYPVLVSVMVHPYLDLK